VAVKTYLGDRRAALRFQVNGELWASIESRHGAVLHNITMSGALLEATLGRDQTPIRTASITLPGGGPELTVTVHHVTRVDAAADRYLLGGEFVQLSSAGRKAIASFIASCQPRDIRSS
jgi:hypothetical protein